MGKKARNAGAKKGEKKVKIIHMRCKNVKYDESYYNEIANTDLQAIANFLYNRDISNFDSTVPPSGCHWISNDEVLLE